ncbi:hypothetical protein P691DRAFT_780550 [Macrolepiota fuliginosa MF-IS2]|uniref:Uncharacterized protein n=1 Tax=Macrolepiota fuliginosa MF-IS2 TaxID=1400762 RepID=A0A9P5WZD8_9AGAR|nr:hypothetical protein P691DRAFT_780550 [Macrolepiota fuliginosa MF-IS2]
MDSIIATLPDTFEPLLASSAIEDNHPLVVMQVENPSNNSSGGSEAFGNGGALDDRSGKELGIVLPDHVLNPPETAQNPAPKNWYFVARGHCPGIYQDALTAGRYASIQKVTILEFGSQADADRNFVDHFMRGHIVRLSEWSEPIPLGVSISRHHSTAPPEEPDDEISWWVVPVARWPGCTKGRTTAERIAGTAKSFIEKANSEADAYRAFVSKYMSGAVHGFFPTELDCTSSVAKALKVWVYPIRPEVKLEPSSARQPARITATPVNDLDPGSDVIASLKTGAPTSTIVVP